MRDLSHRAYRVLTRADLVLTRGFRRGKRRPCEVSTAPKDAEWPARTHEPTVRAVAEPLGRADAATGSGPARRTIRTHPRGRAQWQREGDGTPTQPVSPSVGELRHHVHLSAVDAADAQRPEGDEFDLLVAESRQRHAPGPPGPSRCRCGVASTGPAADRTGCERTDCRTNPG